MTRLLLVEDDLLVCEVLKEGLIELGYDIYGTVNSGEEALRMMNMILPEADTDTDLADGFTPPEHGLPDAILMDIRLEGRLDGIETAGIIRRHASVPVIFLSALDNADLLERAKIREPFGYLIKPVRMRLVHATVEMALYKARIDEENRRLIRELQEALSRVRQLSGMLPICAQCKKIRDDQGYWQLVERYIQKHSDATFTHSICPECAESALMELDQYTG